ncbi:hypothetical protein GW932_03915 [archaeon]|nr:hypothetical protein [archaeon]
MAFNVQGMTDFIKSQGEVIITELILEGDSFEHIPMQEGIKFKERVVDLSDDGTVLQTGDYTETAYSGGTKMLDVDIEVVEYHVKEKYKRRDLESKAIGVAMKKGSSPENLEVKDFIYDLKGKAINKANEKNLWQGVKATDKMDGFLTQVLAGSPITGGTAVALSASTAVATIEALVKEGFEANEAWITNETVMAMSPKNFATYYRALFKQNQAIDGDTLSKNLTIKYFYIPGTSIKVINSIGLTGKNNILWFVANNFRIGVDLKSGQDVFEFEYLNEAMVHRLLAIFKLGAKVINPSQVVVTV